MRLSFSAEGLIASTGAFLRAAATLALRSLVPSLLFLFAPLFFLPSGTFATVVWVFLLVAWILLLGVAEWIRAASRDNWQMQLRQVLASFRKLTNDATTRILSARRSSPTDALSFPYDHDTLMSEVMGAVFFVVSQNNRDLERHFRVTFMQVVDNALWIRYYANTDNEPPVTMTERQCFQIGEGVAGQAWQRNELVIEPDTQRGSLFVPKTTQHRRFDIKSVVCIPVDIWDTASGTRRVIGVLNIDSDQSNYFRNTHSGQRYLEVTIRPYVRLIRLLYAIREVLPPQKSQPS